MKFINKEPVRGDRVIDHSRVIKKEGVIISGVFEPKLIPSEIDVVQEAFVSFSPADREWYSRTQLENKWVEELNAFVLNAESNDD